MHWVDEIGHQEGHSRNELPCCSMVLCWWATSANVDANRKEYFPDSMTESIHSYFWWNGWYLEPMPVWMVGMDLPLRSKTQILVSDGYIRLFINPNSEQLAMRCVRPYYRWRDKWYHVGNFADSSPINWYHLTNLNPRSNLYLMKLYG